MREIENGVLGTPTPVHDAIGKVTGRMRYVDDMRLPGMLYGAILHSPYAHARITEIDTSEAESMPGVHAVVCWKDSPDTIYNGNGEDADLFHSERVFDRIVRYAGDKVAAVAADTKAQADAALAKIHVTYEKLPVMLDPEESAAPGAYPIHENGNVMEEVLKEKGDLQQGFERADEIFEDAYETSAISHAPMEPHVSLAEYDAEGKLTVWTPSQDVFGQRKNLAHIFSLPLSRVRVISPVIGGAFGGKIDLVTEPVSTLLSMKTGRPVKITYTRLEDVTSALTRHAEKIYIRTGVKKDGTLTALDYKVYLSAGAQSGATMSVAWAAGGKFFKIFKIPAMRYHAIPAYTNRMTAGAMRGFGSPQLFYALNSQLNKIARKLGIDYCDLLMKNLFDPNDCDLFGEPLGNFRGKDCVERGRALFGWEAAKAEERASAAGNGRYRIGSGMAVCNHGCSLFGVMPDTCGVMLKMNEDGSITLYTGMSDMGNGSNTIQRMIVSEILGIPADRIAMQKTDTETTMFDVGIYASRGTYVGGGAAEKAADAMRLEILREGAELLGVPEDGLFLADNCVKVKADPGQAVTMAEVAAHAHEKERDLCVSETFGTKAAPICGGAHFARVRVDTQTGEVKVLDYTAVHDVGRPLNRMGLEGQLHGGIHMGIGYALSEGIVLDENGVPKGKRLRDMHLVRADEMPRIQSEFLDSYEPSGPFGAKSVSECATVPSGAAVANAVSNALGHEFHSLPIRKEDILCVLAESETR